MVIDVEIRKRFIFEIVFKDLIFTLKGKKKYLMRCVIGKIFFGRLLVVMGFFGVGKIIFFFVLVGKVIGCKKIGMIFVNGKFELIYLYKRIIGFVF